MKNSLWVQLVSISYDLDELDDLLDQRSYDETELKMRLRNIFAKMVDSDEYFNEFCDLYYWKHLIQPALLTFSIVIALSLFILVSRYFNNLIKAVQNSNKNVHNEIGRMDARFSNRITSIRAGTHHMQIGR